MNGMLLKYEECVILGMPAAVKKKKDARPCLLIFEKMNCKEKT
jgi:hypothetical protein